MAWHFPVFVLVSFVAFIGILRMALNRRSESPPTATVLWVAAVVVFGGMIFARAGTSVGFARVAVLRAAGDADVGIASRCLQDARK
jgi:hypothetical protein